jgi:hypothetical protein
MLLQIEGITPLTDLSPFISFMIFVLMMVLTLYCYSKLKWFELMILIYAISLTISLISIGQNILMFTPFFQIFFMFFQTIVLYKVWVNRD